MIDVKKLEEKEVVFVNQKTTKEEDLIFSKFLKDRKIKNSKSPKKSQKQKA